MRTIRARHRQRMSPLLFVVCAIGVALVMAACGTTNGTEPASGQPGARPATPEAGSGVTATPLQIENVDVIIAESSPPMVTARVQGVIPDSCTKAREPEISRSGSELTIRILGERPAGVMCAQVVSEYQNSIQLGPLGAGDYALTVNGKRKTFTVS